MTESSRDAISCVMRRLGARLLERGWLSSNNVVFRASADAPSTVVDTGYVSHAAQTVALVESCLGSEPLGRIINTHLHSDHCGGNAALQRRWTLSTLVPHDCVEAAAMWDEQRLTFNATGQQCERFEVSGALAPGDTVWLGTRQWEVHAAPGHDTTALMFFEPVDRVLISGDALWEKRLAIVFPELEGVAGFDACLQTLDVIHKLKPLTVLPGHGPAFTDVQGALQRSRDRLADFKKAPARHRGHALRALVMFHMLEVQRSQRHDLMAWALDARLMRTLTPNHVKALSDAIDGLVAAGLLETRNDSLNLKK